MLVYLNMDTKEKRLQKMNKIARIFVCDIRGINFIKIVQLNQFSKSLHEIFEIDSKSHFYLIDEADF